MFLTKCASALGNIPKIDSVVTYLGIYYCAKTVNSAYTPLELVKYYQSSLNIIFVI